MRLPKFTKRYHLKDYKMNLVILVLALSILGVFVIGSAEPDNQSRQIIGLIIALTAMVVVSLIDYVWLMDFYWLIYRSQRRHPVDQPWFYQFSAVGAGKDPADPVFCKIYSGARG